MIKSLCSKDDDDTIAIIHDCALALPTIYPVHACIAVVKQLVCPSGCINKGCIKIHCTL